MGFRNTTYSYYIPKRLCALCTYIYIYKLIWERGELFQEGVTERLRFELDVEARGHQK